MPWSHNESEFFFLIKHCSAHFKIDKILRMKNIFQALWDRFFSLKDNKETKNIFHVCHSYWQYVMIITLVFQNANTYTENERKKSLIIVVLSDIIHFWQRTITLSEIIWIFGEKKSDYKHETMKVITSAQLKWVKLNWIPFQHFSVATCHIWELTFHFLNTGHRYEFHL